MTHRIPTLLGAIFLGSLAPLFAQDSPAPVEQRNMTLEEYFDGTYLWKKEGTGDLGRHATIEIPPGFRYADGSTTAEVMEEFGNLPSTYEGMIGIGNLDWFVVFEFEETGYVDDSEKDDLDADALLKSMKEAEKVSNEERVRRGLDTLDTVGWAVEPSYNEETNNLEWGVILQDGNGHQAVNYLAKVLGRRGIMHTTLVCNPEDLQAVLPAYRKLMEGFSYKEEQAYADFEEGDKVAEYGMKALIAGGALYGAAKLGLLAKLGKFLKPIGIAIVAGFIGFKKFISGTKSRE